MVNTTNAYIRQCIGEVRLKTQTLPGYTKGGTALEGVEPTSTGEWWRCTRTLCQTFDVGAVLPRYFGVQKQRQINSRRQRKISIVERKNSSCPFYAHRGRRVSDHTHVIIWPLHGHAPFNMVVWRIVALLCTADSKKIPVSTPRTWWGGAQK